jgi:hypothetical protein
VATVHWQRDVPADMRSRSSLERVDYADLFTATTSEPVRLTPQHWARALQCSAPWRVRLIVAAASITQRWILGLRVDRPSSSSTMLGWKLADRGDNWFRLEASSSWLGSANLVFRSRGREVCFATLLRYDHPLARVVWTPVSRLHRFVGISLLRYAVSAEGMQSLVQARS